MNTIYQTWSRPDMSIRFRRPGLNHQRIGSGPRPKGTGNVLRSFKSELAAAQSGRDSANPPILGNTPEVKAEPNPTNTNGSVYFQYTVQKGDTLWELAVKRFHVNLEDIIRDNNIKDPDLIYPGQSLIIRRPAIPQVQEVTASWYGSDYHGRPMANGDPFDMHGATIAHKEIPLGTRVELENPATGEKVRAIVTDRGPFVPGRDVDLSYGLAKRLSLVEKGVGRLLMRIV